MDVGGSGLTLAADGVVGTLFVPRTADPVPGVVMVGGSDGGEPQISARRLAQEGFTTLSVAYFKREGLPPTLRDVPLEYFAQALKVLQRAVAPRAGPLVILGVSRGSEAALLSGVHFPDLVHAVVGLVPGNVVLCSWPPGGPAWTLRGKPLPYVSRFGPLADDPAAEIPVERIQGPVLLVSAGRDQVWPSFPMAAAMASRLKARGHPYPDEHWDFPLAGHWLGGPRAGGAGDGPRSSTPDGAREGADAGEILPKTVDFLRRLPQPDR